MPTSWIPDSNPARHSLLHLRWLTGSWEACSLLGRLRVWLTRITCAWLRAKSTAWRDSASYSPECTDEEGKAVFIQVSFREQWLEPGESQGS